MKYLPKIVAFIFIAGLILLLYLGISPKNSKKVSSPLIGQKAPSFTIKTFQGEEIALENLKGKIVVLNFWSSWCIPCRSEVEVLEKAHFSYQNQNLPVKIIGVNIWDEREDALSFIKRYKVSFPNGYDPKGQIQLDYGVSGVPETFFIDKEGKVAHKFTGQLTNSTLMHYINELLEEK